MTKLDRLDKSIDLFIKISTFVELIGIIVILIMAVLGTYIIINDDKCDKTSNTELVEVIKEQNKIIQDQNVYINWLENAVVELDPFEYNK